MLPSFLQGIEHDDVISFNATFDLKLKRFKVPLISLKEIQNLQASTNTGTSSAASGSNPNGAADSGNRHSVEGQTYTDEMGSGLTAEGIPIAVEESRRHQIEAAVVRIMKARKSLVHNELIAETTRQLSHMFTPSAQVCLILHDDIIRDTGIVNRYVFCTNSLLKSALKV